MYHFARRRSACLFLFALTASLTEVMVMFIGPAYSTGRILYTSLQGTVWDMGVGHPGDYLFQVNIYGTAAIGVSIFVLAGYRAMSPKIPDGHGIRTVADTLRIICASQCVEDFAQVSMLGEKERNKTVLGWKEKYAFGVIRGSDNVKRWGVDFGRFILLDRTL
jgi:hypothetical protein